MLKQIARDNVWRWGACGTASFMESIAATPFSFLGKWPLATGHALFASAADFSPGFLLAGACVFIAFAGIGLFLRAVAFLYFPTLFQTPPAPAPRSAIRGRLTRADLDRVTQCASATADRAAERDAR